MPIHTRRSAEAGFSLIEVLIALAILALVMGLVAPRVVGYLGRAKSQTAAAQIDNIKTSLNLFLIDVGRYPSTDEGLDALVEPPAGATSWLGPYVDGDQAPMDPWGRPYRYESRSGGAGFRVFTLGADDAVGGEGESADIG